MIIVTRMDRLSCIKRAKKCQHYRLTPGWSSTHQKIFISRNKDVVVETPMFKKPSGQIGKFLTLPLRYHAFVFVAARRQNFYSGML